MPPHSGDSNWVSCVCEKERGVGYVVGPGMAIAICALPQGSLGGALVAGWAAPGLCFFPKRALGKPLGSLRGALGEL